MKYGFEREFFIKNGSKFIIAPRSLPYDDCGYLVESRGEPHTDPFKAAFLLLAEENRIRRIMVKGLRLILVNEAKLSPELLRDAYRFFGKKSYPQERGNLYGNDYPATDKRCLAGMHVHFSNQCEIKTGKHSVTVNGFLDIPKIVHYLDVTFTKEIKAAKRLPGFYELKGHGFEYRSLPATIDPVKVALALDKGSSSYWKL